MDDFSENCLMAGLACVLGMLGMLGYQSYVYLHDGFWPNLSVLGVVGGWMESEWAANPTSWYGLHNILSVTPLSVGLLAIAVVLFWIGSVAD